MWAVPDVSGHVDPTMLRAIADDLHGAVLYYLRRYPDGRGQYVYMSAGVERMIGMTAAQVMADAASFEALAFRDDWTWFRPMADAAAAAMKPIEADIRARRLDGSAIWVRVHATPRERLDDGSIMWGGVLIDVTAQKRAEETLREREAVLSNLADSLPGTTVYQVVRRPDGSNYFPYMSAGMASVFGVSQGEALRDAASVYSLIVPEDYPLIRTAADESIRTGKPFDVECRLRTPSGEPRWLHIRGRPRPLEDGSTLWDAVSVDVTDRKTLEAERERLHAQMMEGQRLESLAVIAGGIAHDFNNLLSGILGHVEMISRSLPADSPMRARLTRIELAGRRASDLTGLLLAAAGNAFVQREAMSLARIAQDAVARFRIDLPPAVALRLEESSDVPTSADPAQMRQLLVALLTNAQEALTSGSGTIVVRTGARRLTRAELDVTPLGAALPEGDYATVEVEDDGIGMPDDTRARMFDPFFTTKFMGRGLGLAAVLGILRAHEGTVAVASTRGAGTKVSVFLKVP
jgi:PAS domain S-box-containing protein